MRTDDATYFRERVLQEQLASQEATCEAARERHDELATMYRFRAAMIEKRPELWTNALEAHLDLA
jgi:hypothetical protein